MSNYTRKYGYAFEAWRNRHAYTRSYGSAVQAPAQPVAAASFDPALDLGAQIDAGNKVDGTARVAGGTGF
jgi:hypothetical protein